MNLEQFYRRAVAAGIEADPRGRKRIDQVLKDARKRSRSLKGIEKEVFDEESLANPYADTRILVGEPEAEVRSLLIGIDMEIGEVLLAQSLIQSGIHVDCIVAHHPEGRALANFYEVMGMQADILNKAGVPINVAEGLLAPRMREVQRRVMPLNHNRAVDAARLLGIAMVCTHTVADNHVVSFLQRIFDKEKPGTVGEIVDRLLKVPEYKAAAEDGAGPTIINGTKDGRAGKVFVDMTGGTEGPKETIAKLVDAGVGTIVCMHLSDDHRKEAEKHHLNAVIAGHMASDTLGMNLLLDEVLEGADEVQILTCSGFKRIPRKQ